MPSHLPLNLTNLPHPLNIHSATHSPIHFSLRSSATLSQGSSNFLSGNLPCVWGQCLGQRAGGYQRKLTGKVPVESQHLPMPNLRQEQIEGARRQCYVLEVGSQSEAFRACSSLAGSVMHPDSQEALSSVALFTYFLAPPKKVISWSIPYNETPILFPQQSLSESNPCLLWLHLPVPSSQPH